MRGADDIVAAIDKRLAAARQLVERLEQARAALVADSQGPPAAEAPVGIVQPAKPRPALTAVAPAANAKAVLSKTPKQRTEGARTKQAILSTVRMAGDSGLMLGQIVERAGVSQPTASRHLKLLVDANTIVKRGRAYIAIENLEPDTGEPDPDPTLGVKMAPADWPPPPATPEANAKTHEDLVRAARAARDAFNAGQEAKARLNQRTRENAEANIRAALRHKPATIGDLAGRLDIKLAQVRDVVDDMILAGDAREHPALGVILTSVA